ncbi:hypothetical protein [Micromonospora sp. NPDC049679]|uniref:hypothetical protein n=1 Tax=Micromonospora sp. NPDC049679 TaxID=3155920 RepID=UPI003410AFDA
MTEVDVEASGWDTIEAAVAQVVPGRQPLRWGTNALPGQDGIYGLNAYRVDGHRLPVTFGLPSVR